MKTKKISKKKNSDSQEQEQAELHNSQATKKTKKVRRAKSSESQQQEQPEMHNSHTTKLDGHLLMICDISGKIIIASGDAKILCCKIKNLKDQNLFELGFTQHSLRQLQKQSKGSLFKNSDCEHFHLELVNSDKPIANTAQEFQINKKQYLKKITFQCSFMGAKFGQQLPQPGECTIINSSSHLSLRFHRHTDQHRFILIQASLNRDQTKFESNFVDYTSTMNKLPSFKPAYSNITL